MNRNAPCEITYHLSKTKEVFTIKTRWHSIVKVWELLRKHNPQPITRQMVKAVVKVGEETLELNAIYAPK